MNILIKISKVFIFLCYIPFIVSCKKDDKMQISTAIAKVNVINAIIGGGNIKASISSKDLPWSAISDNHIIQYGVGKIFVVPTNFRTYFRVVSTLDTAVYWYNNQRDLKEGKIYTLYLSGNKNAVDTLLKEEENVLKVFKPDLSKPMLVADSIVNLKFVNLASSSPAVDINIAGRTINEVSNLDYQESTSFKAYAASSDINYINLEIRRSSDKSLIASHSVNVTSWGGNLFKSIAIIITGVYDPDLSLPIPDEERYTIKEVLYQ